LGTAGLDGKAGRPIPGWGAPVVTVVAGVAGWEDRDGGNGGDGGDGMEGTDVEGLRLVSDGE